MDFTIERIFRRSMVFDPISGGVLLAGGLGVGSSLLSADAQRSAANAASDATQNAARTAADATLTGTRESIAAQERALAQIRGDNAAFIQPADRALATLQSLIYGQPMQYEQRSLADLGRGGGQPAWGTTPVNGVTAQQMLRMVMGLEPNPNGYTIQDVQRLGQQASTTMTAGGMNPTNGNVTGTATAPSFKFDPTAIQNDPAYQWEKNQGLNDLRTSLMLMGRPSGTVAANATGKFLGNLNAGYGDKYYNRGIEERNNYQNNLLNLLNLARGGTASVGAATQNAANNTSNAYGTQATNLGNIATNAGTNIANANLVKGQSQSNMWNGIGQLPFQAGSLAMMGGWRPFGAASPINAMPGAMAGYPFVG